MKNRIKQVLVKELKLASNQHDAPIWKKLAEFAGKSTNSRRVVNLSHIESLTKENDVVVVPGKILGTGNISHSITISSFSISNTAAEKVIKSGGKIFQFKDMIKNFPTGKGVKFIG